MGKWHEISYRPRRRLRPWVQWAVSIVLLWLACEVLGDGMRSDAELGRAKIERWQATYALAQPK